ncbi:putative pectinesterase 29 [Bienertia sinuspersici]
MSFPCFIILYLTTFMLHLVYMPLTMYVGEVISHVIVVDQSGYGHFRKLQEAIDSVPPNNREWIEIQVRAGVYREKVIIPVNKPYISLVGASISNTVVQWWGGGGSDTLEYSTFSVFSSNFVARNITFKNLFRGAVISQAPAVLVYGDKIAFYKCGFIGVQDTLTDFMGRHFFEGCYIEGYIDFIWGYGQSIYHGCIINVTSGPYDDRIYGAGYITAQGRINMEDNDGFVFKYCIVVGKSYAYLGRPYQTYSRVIFYKSYLSNNVVPQGWNLGFALGHVGSVTHDEIECTGPGADTSQRVKWGRSLAYNELTYLLNPNTFINQDNWIQNQPLPTKERWTTSNSLFRSSQQPQKDPGNQCRGPIHSLSRILEQG